MCPDPPQNPITLDWKENSPSMKKSIYLIESRDS